VATKCDERWRVVDHLQTLRIISFAECDQRHTEFARGFDFLFGPFARADLRRAVAAAASESRQRFERRACAAELIEKRAKRARADILAANEPQPIDPLLTAFVLPN
jgi:hypothetical protein